MREFSFSAFPSRHLILIFFSCIQNSVFERSSIKDLIKELIRRSWFNIVRGSKNKHLSIQHLLMLASFRLFDRFNQNFFSTPLTNSSTIFIQLNENVGIFYLHHCVFFYIFKQENVVGIITEGKCNVERMDNIMEKCLN